MLRFVLIGLAATFTLYAFIDAARTPASEIQILPKWLWLLFIAVGWVVGGMLWMMIGRAAGPAGEGGTWRQRAPLAPDDDPAFLRELDQRAWRERMERMRRETRDSEGDA